MEQSEKELMRRGIAIGIGLLLFDLIFVYFVLYRMLKLNVLLFLVCLLLPYYLGGQHCGKRWQNPSWKWGFWLIIPLIFLQILLYILISINPELSIASGFGNVILVGIIFDSVLVLISSIGAIVGARLVDDLYNYWMKRIIALVIGSMMAILNAYFFFYSPNKLLIIIFTIIYLFIGFTLGNYWPEVSWKWGLWIILPFYILLLVWNVPLSGQFGQYAHSVFTSDLGLGRFSLAAIGANLGAIATKHNLTIVYLRRIITALLAGSIVVYFPTILIKLFGSMVMNVNSGYVIVIYFIIGYILGHQQPESSWRWGLLIVIPWFIFIFAQLLPPYKERIYVDPGSTAYGFIFGLIFLFVACFGAYIGALVTRKKEMKI